MITRREILRRLALGGIVSPLLLRRAGAAYSFTSASSQYLEIGSAVATAVPITMACWFRASDTTADMTLISIARSNANQDLFQLAAWGTATSDRLVANARQVGSNGICTGATSYSANTWTHACAVFSANNSREIFFNGSSDGTDTTSVTPASLNRTSIGRLGRLTPAGYMSGLIAEVGIWSVALSAEEIAALAKGVVPRKVRPQSLLVTHPLIRENVAPFGPAFTAYNSPTIAVHPRIYR